MALRMPTLDALKRDALSPVLILVAWSLPERLAVPEPDLRVAGAPDQEGEPTWEDAAWQ